MKRYYAGQSDNGSSTSHGFSNDWTVYAFSSKLSRDEFVANSTNISCIAIPAKDATKYAANYSLTSNKINRPTPFTNEFWGIVDSQYDSGIKPVGCIGYLSVCDEYTSDMYETVIPFY